MAKARCGFYVRTAVEGGFSYEPIHVRSPDGSTRLITEHVPRVGDVIFLYGDTEETRGGFVVLAVQWSHSSWGSVDWPYGENESTVGPLVDVIVEPTVGVFVDEAEEGPTDG